MEEARQTLLTSPRTGMQHLSQQGRDLTAYQHEILLVQPLSDNEQQKHFTMNY